MKTLTCLAGLLCASLLMAAPVIETDLCVYGGTSGGVIAAVQAARLGKSVTLVHNGNHLGGMTSGGLGVTDVGQVGAIGGLSREFYRRVGQRYGGAERFQFEPHVAEEVFNQLVAEAGVAVYTNQLLATARKTGARLTEITMTDGAVFRARMFVDTTYEGDLMAAAGVTFTVGREGTNTYGESLAGARIPSATGYDYDPFVTPGNPASGLLPLLQTSVAGPIGSGDHRVQAYNFRLCLTQVATNKLPILPPANYSEARYELVARYVEARLARNGSVTLGQLMDIQTLIPNGKTDINANGELSTDYVGGSWTWATNTPAGRAALRQEHEDYLRGLFHFLATSLRVPLNVRTQMQTYGLARDEFTDTGGWPHQIYVREARRLVGDYVMTQADAHGQRFAPDPIGLASYSLDSHALTRIADGGFARTEGGFFVAVPQPFSISYRAIIPQVGECENLFCTFALSASHVAFASCRMEPVFMLTSQSAATAAALAIDDGVPVQQVSYAKLALQLRADGQLLDWVGGTLTTNGLVLDNGEPGVAQVGSWVTSTSQPGYWGANYLHDQNAGKGAKYLRYTPNLPFSGAYDVFARWTAFNNRATSVPLDIVHMAGTNRVFVDQTQNDATWVWLLRTNFVAGQGGGVILRNEGATGFVIADAVRFLPVTNFTVPPATVQLVASDPVAIERTTNTARVAFVRRGDPGVPLTVNYRVDGAASNGVDYATLSGVVAFPSGVTATSLVIRPLPDAAAEVPETVVISLAAGAGYVAGAFSNATVTLFDRPYAAWRARQFTAAQLADAAISGDGADPDLDSLTNLAEYALGLNPLVPDLVARPQGSHADDRLQLAYQHSKGARDAILSVDTADDFSDWSGAPDAVEVSRVTDQGLVETIVQRRVQPVSASRQGFLRLNVGLAP